MQMFSLLFTFIIHAKNVLAIESEKKKRFSKKKEVKKISYPKGNGNVMFDTSH